MVNVQQIRRSQFVLTYGPGSIIEGENGSRIIPSLENGLDNYFSEELLEKFEINDTRMSNILQRDEDRENARIFALPSNASLNRPESDYIYNTYIFPRWKVCYNKKHKDPILYSGKSCPVCHKENASNVRFVAACPEGHLDDVNWHSAVHKGKDCNSHYYYWKANGSSLADIVIECANPNCNSKTTMEEIYRTNFPCSGRIPENEERGSYYREPKRNWNCKGRMKVIQRQSTALRIAETFTLLTIPQYDTSIVRIIQRNDIKLLLKLAFKVSANKKEFIDNLKTGGLSSNTIKTLEEFIEVKGYDKFREYVKNIYEQKTTVNTLMNEEFESLRGKPKFTENFIKNKPFHYNFPGLTNFELEVYPIEKLRTVTVQNGYRRLPYMKKEGESKLQSSGVYCDENLWYPGFEGIGEGIFISSNKNPLKYFDNLAIEEWNKRKVKEENRWKGNVISWREGKVMEPQFVWWHTLSHSLIRTLSLISGYSSASLRERVYVDDSLEHGGILIYTSSAGEDGGMGGLVETAQNFEEILTKAVESLLICSNDPLCSEIRISDSSVNGSACHNCLMTSETSCEHGNMWLDRHILMDGLHGI